MRSAAMHAAQASQVTRPRLGLGSPTLPLGIQSTSVYLRASRFDSGFSQAMQIMHEACAAAPTTGTISCLSAGALREYQQQKRKEKKHVIKKGIDERNRRRLNVERMRSTPRAPHHRETRLRVLETHHCCEQRMSV